MLFLKPKTTKREGEVEQEEEEENSVLLLFLIINSTSLDAEHRWKWVSRFLKEANQQKNLWKAELLHPPGENLSPLPF
jgi:hypothetical protein